MTEPTQHGRARGHVRARPFRVRSLKARLDEKRRRSERFADTMSAVFGSNLFLWLNVIVFAVWIAINTGAIPVIEPFDPYPFGFLTLAVSLEAIVLSIFVLIAQNRTERIDELRGEIDLQVNLIAEAELTKLLELVAKIAEKQGIDVSGDRDLDGMLSPTNVEKLEHVLEAQLARHSDDVVAEG